MGQEDDHGMSGGAGRMTVPEADRDGVRSIGLPFLRVGQGAIGEQNMKVLPSEREIMGMDSHKRERRPVRRDECRWAKVEIAMGNVLFDQGIVLHGSALRGQDRIAMIRRRLEGDAALNHNYPRIIE